MSAAISPSTGRSYGVQRVCRVWAVARSTFYAAAERTAPHRVVTRRGPVPPVDEASLLAAIQADLAQSPFQGEGHRKVWARLRYGRGLAVGRNRVLRVMREHRLLSPHRRPPRPANDHDGTILTDAPNVLWGTDATMVQTVEDGRVWIFAALDHFNSEVVGHYVSTDGSRFSALEPISQGVTAHFGGVEAAVARGVSVRADNGPQYTAQHFTRQVKHWGMTLLHRGGGASDGVADAVDYAMRTDSGRPRSSMRFRTRTATPISVCCRSSVWKRRPSPITCL